MKRAIKERFCMVIVCSILIAWCGCLQQSTLQHREYNQSEPSEKPDNITIDPWDGNNELLLYDGWGQIDAAVASGTSRSFVWVGLPEDPTIHLFRKNKVPIGTKSLEITLDWNNTITDNGIVIDLELGVIDPTNGVGRPVFWTPDPATPFTKPYTYIYPVTSEMTNSSSWGFTVVPDTVILPLGIAVSCEYHLTVVAVKGS